MTILKLYSELPLLKPILLDTYYIKFVVWLPNSNFVDVIFPYLKSIY